MAELKQNPTLRDIQVYIKECEVERGFINQTPAEALLITIGEIGEVAAAMRTYEGLSIDEKTEPEVLELEFGDVLFCMGKLANRYNIDLEEAFRKKEEINKTRVWIKK